MMSANEADESTRLLQNAKSNGGYDGRQQNQRNTQSSASEEDSDDDEEEGVETIFFEKDDPENPKNWSLRWKYVNVFLVFFIGLMCPMTSSVITPAMDVIAKTFDTTYNIALGAQSGFVCMLGIGPLFFAPMSETFGRRPVFLINLTLFTLLQIPTALAPSIEWLIVLRTLGGFFGSVGVANGGGTISDMFETHERATVLGFYLLGPLLGPTLGPFVGGLIAANLQWRWMFWFTFVLAAVTTIVCYFLLQETCAPIILYQRKKKLEEENKDKTYKVEGQSDIGILQKIAGNSSRATKILFQQPIVLTLSAYQALIFSSMYSLYTNYSKIWKHPVYDFDTAEVAFSYLAPAAGFVVAAIFIVPYIDHIYQRLKKHYSNDDKPEYRLPLANVGAIFLPCSLFWFAWTVEHSRPWPVPLCAMLLFGASQVSIFNSVQNYYIDAFESMAASALAAGAFLRSVVGGIVPLFVPTMIEKIGYGWGLSVFGFIAVALMPAPLLFFWYGARLRERFPLNL